MEYFEGLCSLLQLSELIEVECGDVTILERRRSWCPWNDLDGFERSCDVCQYEFKPPAILNYAYQAIDSRKQSTQLGLALQEVLKRCVSIALLSVPRPRSYGCVSRNPLTVEVIETYSTLWDIARPFMAFSDTIPTPSALP